MYSTFLCALFPSLRDFTRIFLSKREPCASFLLLSRNRPENHSNNFGKALGKGLGLLCAPFTFSIPFTSLSLSPLYTFHLSIPFTSLSLSPLSLSLSNNLEKALGKGLGLLCSPFTLSIPFTSLSLSPLYTFHLSIPFTSLSHSNSLSLSIISPFLSLSLLLPFFPSLSFSIILFGVSNGCFNGVL